MKKEELSKLQVAALGTLFGIIGGALYNVFKEWITPFMLEGRALTYSDNVRILIHVIATGLTLLTFTFFLYAWGIWKPLKKEKP